MPTAGSPVPEDPGLATARDQGCSGGRGSSRACNVEGPERFDAAGRFVAPDEVRRAGFAWPHLARRRRHGCIEAFGAKVQRELVGPGVQASPAR